MSGARSSPDLGAIVAAMAVAWRIPPAQIWQMPFAEFLRLTSRASAAPLDRAGLDVLLSLFPDFPQEKNEHAGSHSRTHRG